MTDEAMVPGAKAERRKPGYWNGLRAAYGHAVLMLLRRQRIILAAVICLLPVLVPLAMAFMSSSQFADNGAETFQNLTVLLQINVLAPLMALFFATMLVGEDIESQTIPYVLTRPLPRSAWVLGRFLAYLTVAAAIQLLAVVLTFAACTTLDNLAFSEPGLVLLARYCLVCVFALVAYGALAVLLGIGTKRPIVYGVVLLYGWQRMAMLVPGLVDFLTIQKYTDALLPVAPQAGLTAEIQTAIGTFQKEVFMVTAPKAALTLLGITAVLLGITVFLVRFREFAASRAAGT